MSLTQIASPYLVFTDKDGTPLDDGYIYVGETDKNPETNPIDVYWDAGLTLPAPQPIRTNNGYPWRMGTPSLLYAATNSFSITIKNKKQELVVYAPKGFGSQPNNSLSVVYQPPYAGGVETTVEDKLAQYVSVKDFGAVGDGVTDDTAALKAAIAASQNRILFLNAGTYAISEPLYLGTYGSVVGEGPKASKIKLLHSGLGLITKTLGQPQYTRNQIYENFGIVCNSNTTRGFWANRTLYCNFKNIEVTVPQSTGSGFTGFRIAGSVYLCTFTNCVSDTIEESSTKHGGRGWWIGNGENEDGSLYAATNENTFITCRGVRANIGIDIDAANGGVYNACGGETCTTAGIRLAGSYNTVVSPWIEDAKLLVERYTQGDGSGGFLAPQKPAYNTVIPGRPINVTMTSGSVTTFLGGRLDNVTIDADAAGTCIVGSEILGGITDNGEYSSLQYRYGGNPYNIVKNGFVKVYEQIAQNNNLILNFPGSKYLKAHAFFPFELSSTNGFLITGTGNFIDVTKIPSVPSAPSADTARLYVDSSGGKNRLMVRFPSGAAQQISIEP